MDWLILAGYVAVWLVYGWRLTVYLLDTETRRKIEEFPTLYGGKGGAAKAAKNWFDMYLVAGFGLALFWPVVLPVRAFYRSVLFFSGGTLFRTPIEREEAEREELEQLRRQARELGLPMPGQEQGGTVRRSSGGNWYLGDGPVP